MKKEGTLKYKYYHVNYEKSVHSMVQGMYVCLQIWEKYHTIIRINSRLNVLVITDTYT